MYLKHFGLRTDPFRLDPNLDFVFVSRGHEEAIAHLVYGLEQGEHFVLITGGIGTGKTLSLHYLLEQVDSQFRKVFINVTQINFLELLKMILDELAIEFERGADKADLLRSLKSYVLQMRKNNERVLLVVDEAQELSQDTLEGVRLLSNLTQPGQQNLQIVLSGQPGLAAKVDSPELEQLRQRIRVRYDLEPLRSEEIGPYIEHRLAVAGRKEPLFENDALQRILAESGGVPRLVNFHADKALLAAYVDGSRSVTAKHIEADSPREQATPAATPVVLPPKPARVPEPVAPEVTPARAAPGTTAATSGSRKGALAALWILFPLVLAGGAWYVYSNTDLLDRFPGNRISGNESPAPTRQSRPVDDKVAKVNRDNILEQSSSSSAASDSAKEPSLITGLPEQVEETPPEIQVEQQGTGVSDQIATEISRPEPDNPVQAQTTPEPQASPEVATVAPSYVVHVTSFRDEARAKENLSSFSRQGIGGFVQDISVDDRHWFRVYLGPFLSSEKADALGRDLRNQGEIEYFLVAEHTVPSN